MKITKIIDKVFNQIVSTVEKKKEWKDNEYFDDTWRNRINLMSEFIPEGSSVMDLGCGQMWLKEMLLMSEYIPVDYCDRGIGTQIFDFNNKEFPNNRVDYSFVSGCLEYMVDPKWFISQLARSSSACVISYCTTEIIMNLQTRKQFCWENHLSRADIISFFQEENMYLKNETYYLTKNNIFVFIKEENS